MITFIAEVSAAEVKVFINNVCAMDLFDIQSDLFVPSKMSLAKETLGLWSRLKLSPAGADNSAGKVTGDYSIPPMIYTPTYKVDNRATTLVTSTGSAI
ncbi:hypothetical protein BgiBS90_011941 [Biomphalaria glabrata]|nr:hypothetical protein BgiBS90_011941 [Biomphalaria glabrata]